jgi:hypothetical protein
VTCLGPFPERLSATDDISNFLPSITITAINSIGQSEPAMQTPPAKPPHPGNLIKVIRDLAAQGKVDLTSHAADERMDERGISFDDVLEIFRLGDIEGTIEPGKRTDEWKCLVRGRLNWSGRDAGVATVVVRKDRLIVVTTEWMDK